MSDTFLTKGMESEMLDRNSMFMMLIAWEYFVAFGHCES